MYFISKLAKVFIHKVFNFYLQYGKLCFFCTTISMIVTIILLLENIKINNNKNILTANHWHREPLQQGQIQLQGSEVNIVTVVSKRVTKSLSEMMQAIPEINNDIVFLNSVPKSGSELIVLLLQRLQELNGFKHVRLSSRNNQRLSRYEQEKLIDEITTNVRDGAVPFSFDRCVYFINFTSIGHQCPTYINFIRDPIDTAIARFYYDQVTPVPAYSTVRHGSTNVEKKSTTSSWKTKLHYAVVREFERCVKRDDPKCTFKNDSPYDLTIPYFCGHDEPCMKLNNKWALNRAKEVVERYYSVIGVLEEVNATFAVLQHRLPYFFRNSLDIYRRQFSDLKKRRAFDHSLNILDKEVKKKLESQLSMEYEFYNFVKRRLLQHYAVASEELYIHFY